MPRRVAENRHDHHQAEEQGGETDQGQGHQQGGPQQQGAGIEQEGAQAGHGGGRHVGVVVEHHRHGDDRNGENTQGKHAAQGEPGADEGIVLAAEQQADDEGAGIDPGGTAEQGEGDRRETLPHQADQREQQAEESERFAVVVEALNGIDEERFPSRLMLAAQLVQPGGEQRGDQEETGNRHREQVRPVERGEDDQVAAQREEQAIGQRRQWVGLEVMPAGLEPGEWAVGANVPDGGQGQAVRLEIGNVFHRSLRGRDYGG